MESQVRSSGSKPWPDLDAVIREGQIDLAFQPIVRTLTGDIVALEALSRPRAESGFSNPALLFASAEAFNRSWELESLVRQKLAQVASGLPADRMVFFNTSPGVFADERYPDAIEEFREQSGLDKSRFVLEITERAESDGSGSLEHNALLLRDRGYQIAIDDMGAGSSGLNRVMALRPSWLKLDRDIIKGIDNDAYRQNLVRFLAYFTRLGGARLIAEGVETIDELNTIFDLGADCVQGFAIARPGAIDQALDPSISAWMVERGSLVERECETIVRLRTIEPIVVHPSACRTKPTGAIPPIDASATIADALCLLADRDDADAMGVIPIVSANGERLALRVTDLLRAAAKQLGDESLHSSAMYEMPDGFACELAFQRRILSADESSIVVIDVRRMSSYNAAVGNDLGDLLLRHLAALLRGATRRHSGAFVGHLGDDRFVVIASPNAAGEIVEEVVLRFDRASVRYAGASSSDASTWLESPTLRVAVIPQVFRRISKPRQIRRLAERIHEHAPANVPTGSQVIVVDDALLEALGGSPSPAGDAARRDAA
jgi:EAL domain-containing protein (putative c-di-GMP-specific phosphodiesterase class I)/GGDEF domain-containing protein